MRFGNYRSMLDRASGSGIRREKFIAVIFAELEGLVKPDFPNPHRAVAPKEKRTDERGHVFPLFIAHFHYLVAAMGSLRDGDGKSNREIPIVRTHRGLKHTKLIVGADLKRNRWG